MYEMASHGLVVPHPASSSLPDSWFRRNPAALLLVVVDLEAIRFHYTNGELSESVARVEPALSVENRLQLNPADAISCGKDVDIIEVVISYCSYNCVQWQIVDSCCSPSRRPQGLVVCHVVGWVCRQDKMKRNLS